MKKYSNRLLAITLAIILAVLPLTGLVSIADEASFSLFSSDPVLIPYADGSSGSQRAVINVDISPETAEVGETINLTIDASVTTTGDSTDGEFEVSIEGWTNELICNYFQDTNTFTYDPSQGSQVTFTLERNGDNAKIKFTLDPGQTLSFSFEFGPPNGISGELQSITATPSISNPKPGDSAGAKDTGTWTGTFDWMPVQKNVDQTRLYVTEEGKLNENLHYTVSANSNNQLNTGMVWTDMVTLTDSLQLPEGVSFPEDSTVQNGQLVYNGNVLFSLSDLPANATVIMNKTSDRLLDFSVVYQNPNFNAQGVLTAEMQSVGFTANLVATQLNVASSFTPQGYTTAITNNVHLDADAYNSTLSDTSDASAITIIDKRGVDTDFSKSVTDQNKVNNGVSAGDSIEYELKVDNRGDVPAENHNVTDILPLGLTLSDAERTRLIDETGAVISTTDDGRTQITWNNVNVPAAVNNVNHTWSVKYTATVLSAEQLANLGINVTYLRNSASYNNGSQQYVDVTFNRPTVSLAKSADKGSVSAEDEIITYTLTATATGGNASYVPLVDTLPAHLTPLDDSNNPITTAGTYRIGGHDATVSFGWDGAATIKWIIPTMHQNAPEYLTVKTRVDDLKNIQVNTLTNTFSSDYSNDKPQVNVSVNRPTLKLDKYHYVDVENENIICTGTNCNHPIGDIFYFKMTATNTSTTATATDITMTDTLPAGLTPMYYNTTGVLTPIAGPGTYAIDGKQVTISRNYSGQYVVTWTVDTLAPGGSTTLTLPTQVGTLTHLSGSTQLTNVYTSDYNGWDDDKINITVPVVEVEKRSQSAVDNPNNADDIYTVGNTVPYTMTVRNTGTIALSNVSVRDTLPVGFTPLTSDGTEIPQTGGSYTLISGEPAATVTYVNGRYVVEWRVNLAANETKTLHLNAKIVSASGEGTVTIRNHLDADYSTGGYDDLTIEFPKYSLDKSHKLKEPDIYAKGDYVKYYMTIKNEGALLSGELDCYDEMPWQLSPVTATGENYATYDKTINQNTTGLDTLIFVDNPDGTITPVTDAKVTVNSNNNVVVEWKYGSLAPDTSVTFWMYAQVNSIQGINGDTLVNTFRVENIGEDTDSIPVDKGMHHYKYILPDPADVTNRVEESVLNNGDSTTYLLILENTSDEDKTFGNVTDALPAPYYNGAYNTFKYSQSMFTFDFNVGDYYFPLNKCEGYNLSYNLNNDWGGGSIGFGNIIVPAGKSAAVKVTINWQITETGWANWIAQTSHHGEGIVTNKLKYTGSEDRVVQHTLYTPPPPVVVEESSAYVQKGVYRLAPYDIKQYDYNGGFTGEDFGPKTHVGTSKYQYEDSNSYVAYYIVVANTGDTVLNVTSATDALPSAAFKYLGMANQASSWYYSYPNNMGHLTNSITTVSYTGEALPVEYSGIQHDAAVSVNVTSTQVGNDINFAFGSDGTGVELAPGKMFAFVIVCLIDPGIGEASENNLSVTVAGDSQLGENPGFYTTSANGLTPNDGGCTKDDFDSTTNTTTFHSSVTIAPHVKEDDIYPGIDKELTQYIDTLNNTRPYTDTAAVASSDELIWTITLYNNGIDAMKINDLDDLIEYPYTVKGDPVLTYNSVTYELKDPEVTKLDKDRKEIDRELAKGDITQYRYDVRTLMDGSPLTLQPGERATLTVHTKNTTSNYSDGIFHNTALMWPTSSFVAAYPGKAWNERDGRFYSVEDNASITIRPDFLTSSYKVARDPVSRETALSTEATAEALNYVVLDETNTEKKVEYLLVVENDGALPLTELVIIDNLPHKGDQGVLNTDKRQSAFEVKISSEPVVRVYDINGKLITTLNAGSDYVVQYTTEPDVFRDDDFKGVDTAKWNATLSTAASLRIKLTGYELPSAHRVVISFEGIVQGNPESNQVAWNNFAYYCKSGTHEQKAGPPRVGVAVAMEILKADFEFTKVDSDTKAPLNGVTFRLDIMGEHSNTAIARVTSGSDGTNGHVSFTGLEEGTYLLYEENTLPGYMTNQGYWEVCVEKAVDGAGKVNLVVNIISKGGAPQLTTDETGNLLLPNSTPPTLPSTGGSGTLLATLCGLMLMLTACAMSIYTKKREGKGARS